MITDPLAPPRSSLSQPLTLPCGVTLPNRLGKSAMTEGLADASGDANARHARLYRKWAEGGAGLLITGNVMVDWRYLERPGNVVVENDSTVAGRDSEALRRWAAEGTVAGNQLWAQISHPGRQCSRMSNTRPVAPSAIQLELAGFFGRPRALEDGEIVDIVARYATTASILQQAGFTGVQIHGAHGYLPSQFLSPRVNRRTDRWGGSLENRARFLLEVVRVTRQAVGPDFPVAVKLNSADFQRGGFELDDAARVAGWLAEEGIDLLEVSGGTYERLRFFENTGTDDTGEDDAGDGSTNEDETTNEAVVTRQREAFFLDYAQTLRREIGQVPMMVTGGFRTRAAMEAAVADGRLDVVGLARPLCVDPDLPRGLLDGSVTTTPRWESGHRLGPGPLGPNSPSRSLRGFNHQASVAWFYRQILALADDRPLPTTMGARGALARHLWDEARLATARRRRWRARS